MEIISLLLYSSFIVMTVALKKLTSQRIIGSRSPVYIEIRHSDKGNFGTLFFMKTQYNLEVLYQLIFRFQRFFSKFMLTKYYRCTLEIS